MAGKRIRLTPVSMLHYVRLVYRAALFLAVAVYYLIYLFRDGEAVTTLLARRPAVLTERGSGSPDRGAARPFWAVRENRIRSRASSRDSPPRALPRMTSRCRRLSRSPGRQRVPENSPSSSRTGPTGPRSGIQLPLRSSLALAS